MEPLEACETEARGRRGEDIAAACLLQSRSFLANVRTRSARIISELQSSLFRYSIGCAARCCTGSNRQRNGMKQTSASCPSC